MSRLIDRKTLMANHPALNNRWRIEWLVRTRQIPLVRIGTRIYFEEETISRWILGHAFNGEDQDEK